MATPKKIAMLLFGAGYRLSLTDGHYRFSDRSGKTLLQRDQPPSRFDFEVLQFAKGSGIIISSNTDVAEVARELAQME